MTINLLKENILIEKIVNETGLSEEEIKKINLENKWFFLKKAVINLTYQLHLW